MDFTSATPSIVKSVKQRDLLNAWLRLLEKDGHPALTDYKPDRLDDERRDLVFYKVCATDNGPRFLIDSEGSRLAQGYGRVNQGNKGTWLDEYLDPEVAPIVLPVYAECTRRGRPVYTVTQVHDVRGRMIDYERLMLPFFTNRVLTEIMISAKLISEASRFELNNMFRVREKLPAPVLRAVIDRELSAPSMRSRSGASNLETLGSDVIEI
jgi:hypothetical protein